MNPNFLLLTDSYKLTHWLQYPPGTSQVYSYLESRGGRWSEVVANIGLQYQLLNYFEGPVVTQDAIEEAEAVVVGHLGNKKLFNRVGWEHIVRKHGGRLPLTIKAVPEGTVVPPLNVLMTVENTDSACWWLTNYVETLLVQTWYGMTVATQSREIKKLIGEALERTGDPAGLLYKLHDFGFRGVSSVESAAIGGMAHLVNFRGTDTLAGLMMAAEYYDEAMAGHSIPAAEHSTVIAWGQEHEVDAYRNMIQQFGDGALYAVVSDSYDVYEACKNLWGGTLLQEVLGAKGTLVVRPDSGVPHQVVVDVISTLMGKFGFNKNAKGYDVLNPKVRVIQGDGVDYEEIQRILAQMEIVHQSADNIAFGMGGALLQKLHRDTQQFAFKCSNVVVNGEERPVSKRPVTDLGKASKGGRLKLVQVDGGHYRTVSRNNWVEGRDELVEVFRDGEVINLSTFAEVRARAAVV